MIPKDIQDKIENCSPHPDAVPKPCIDYWKMGAEFGYSLASPKQEQEARIKELEDGLEAAKLALKEIYTGTDFPLSIAQNALQLLTNKPQ